MNQENQGETSEHLRWPRQRARGDKRREDDRALGCRTKSCLKPEQKSIGEGREA